MGLCIAFLYENNIFVYLYKNKATGLTIQDQLPYFCPFLLLKSN